MIPFSDLARAAFCPRQCYYARRDGERSIPPEARTRIDLAFRYPELVDAPDATLRRLPIRRSPAAYRQLLDQLRERPVYDRLVDPVRERAYVSGRDCHGLIQKVIEPPTAPVPEGDTAPDGSEGESTGGESPRAPVIVSPGEPPEEGVWEPQSVRAVAAAKALAWELQRPVRRAYLEYPTVGVVRELTMTTRRKAAYRRALRAVRSIDGPPARVDDNRCTGCAYRERCGSKRRSLRSLLT